MPIRALQDKLLRTLILECIGLAVHAYLRRQPRIDGTASRGRTDAWLARTTKPIMVNVRKGNFQFPEQQVRRVSSAELHTTPPTLGTTSKQVIVTAGMP